MYSLKVIFELYNKILQFPLLIFSVNRKSTDWSFRLWADEGYPRNVSCSPN